MNIQSIREDIVDLVNCCSNTGLFKVVPKRCLLAALFLCVPLVGVISSYIEIGNGISFLVSAMVLLLFLLLLLVRDRLNKAYLIEYANVKWRVTRDGHNVRVHDIPYCSKHISEMIDPDNKGNYVCPFCGDNNGVSMSHEDAAINTIGALSLAKADLNGSVKKVKKVRLNAW